MLEQGYILQSTSELAVRFIVSIDTCDTDHD